MGCRGFKKTAMASCGFREGDLCEFLKVDYYGNTRSQVSTKAI
jgi:hypothetical protein